MRSHATRLLQLLPFAFALVLLGYRANLISQQSSELCKHDDFNHYYATAYLLHSGVSPYGMPFTDTVLKDQMVWQRLVPSATNPPFLAFLTYPLALFTPAAAWVYWNLFLLTCALGCLWLVTRRIYRDWSIPAQAACWTMFLGSTAFFSNIVLSQVQPLILLLVILGWADWRSERPTRAALLWGTATAIKLYTWPLLLLPLVNGKSRSFLAGATAAALIFLMPGVIFGESILVGFVRFGLPIIQKSADSLSQNLSIAHVAAQVLPHTQVFQLATGYLLPGCFLAIVAVLCARRGRSSERELDLQVVVIGTLSFFCAPVSWESYMVALLLPFAAAWHYSSRSRMTAGALFLLWLFIFYRPHPARLSSLPFAELYEQAHYPLMTIGALLAILVSARTTSSPASLRGRGA